MPLNLHQKICLVLFHNFQESVLIFATQYTYHVDHLDFPEYFWNASLATDQADLL